MNPSATVAPENTRAQRLPFAPRGPLSSAVLTYLVRGPGSEVDPELEALAREVVERSPEIALDDDIQVALYALYALYASAYGAFEQFLPDLEWDPGLIAVRRVLEAAYEAELRDAVVVPELPEPRADAVARALFTLTSADSGPSLSRYLSRKATLEQAEEFLIQRSIYTLREADPHSWAIPRLTGRPKAALVEIQSDEYGGGRTERVHAEIFARTMRGAGLDASYGSYLDRVPAVTLASLNTMSMFGLNRRLLGAIVGHLAAFEMTSSIPNRMCGDGFRRFGFDEAVTDYFDEHVEADAVHEQIAGRDLAGALAEDRPELLQDIMFGAAACLAVDGRMGAHMFEQWSAGRSSLRPLSVASGGSNHG